MHHFERILRDFEEIMHLSYLSDSVLLEQPYIFSDGLFVPIYGRDPVYKHTVLTV